MMQTKEKAATVCKTATACPKMGIEKNFRVQNSTKTEKMQGGY